MDPDVSVFDSIGVAMGGGLVGTANRRACGVDVAEMGQRRETA